MMPAKKDPATLKRLDLRARIRELEATLLQLPQQDIEIRHQFSGGMYARSMLAPAGSLITGEIYKKAHYVALAFGRVTVVTETEGAQHFKAPAMWAAPAGTKRVILVLEDTLWTTIVATEALTPEEAMADVTVKSFEDLEDIWQAYYRLLG